MTMAASGEAGEIEGRYFEPGAARAHAASMTISGHLATIRFARDGMPETSVREIVNVGARLGNVPRRIELEGGALFEAPADAPINAVQSRESRMLARVFRLETSWRSVVVLVVATVLLVAGLFRYGVPVLAGIAARVTPAPVAVVMDAGTLETVDRTLL